MKNKNIYLIGLSVLYNLLFYNLKLGINVILFHIPFLIFLIYYLLKNDLVKNKNGLLFIIPVIILSMNYFIFNNFYSRINKYIIPLFYIIMIIYTVNPPKTITKFITKIFYEIVKPFDYLDDVKKELQEYEKKLSKESKTIIQIIKSTIIILPIVIIVLLLLTSADSLFDNILGETLSLIFKMLRPTFIMRILSILFFFFYISLSLIYIKKDLTIEEDEEKEENKSNITVKLLLTVLNIIYIIFDWIQIQSLFFHNINSSFNYADYARRGFFQLMIISFINFSIILFSKSKKDSYVKIMSIVILILTGIIICSSFYRMFLYEQAYGYTILRLGVYVILVTEMILIVPTILYILKENINILNYYVIIITGVYTIINLFSVDNIITNNNIKRYYKINKIDIDYLENNNYDNIPLLISLKKNCKDNYLKDEIDFYLKERYQEIKKEKEVEKSLSSNYAESLLK